MEKEILNINNMLYDHWQKKQYKEKGFVTVEVKDGRFKGGAFYWLKVIRESEESNRLEVKCFFNDGHGQNYECSYGEMFAHVDDWADYCGVIPDRMTVLYRWIWQSISAHSLEHRPRHLKQIVKLQILRLKK